MTEGKSPDDGGGVLTLIGGPARVGKTTLSRRWAAERSAEFVHLDHLLKSVVAVARGRERRALEKAPSINTHTPEEWLAELRQRDEVLWLAAQAYAIAACDELVMEGGLWPDWVATLRVPHVAVFIVDTAEDMADRLVGIARENPQSWMAQRGWPDEKIRKWATYNRYRSDVIAGQAARHGYRVFDIAGGISRAQDEVVRYLSDNLEGLARS